MKCPDDFWIGPAPDELRAAVERVMRDDVGGCLSASLLAITKGDFDNVVLYLRQSGARNDLIEFYSTMGKGAWRDHVITDDGTWSELLPTLRSALADKYQIGVAGRVLRITPGNLGIYKLRLYC